MYVLRLDQRDARSDKLETLLPDAKKQDMGYWLAAKWGAATIDDDCININININKQTTDRLLMAVIASRGSNERHRVLRICSGNVLSRLSTSSLREHDYDHLSRAAACPGLGERLN